MRPPSHNWFREIERSRDRAYNEAAFGSFPIFPWLAPALHPELRSLIERWGVVRKVNAREPILGNPNNKVDQLVLVRSGITARFFGLVYRQSNPAMAFSVPGRLACGNLNFFSGRPCYGNYFAVVPSEVVSVPQSLVRQMCETNARFAMLVASEFEKISLSDRLGFGLLAKLDVENRFLAFLLSWAVTFGHMEMQGEEAWVRMPARRLSRCSTARAPRSTAIRTRSSSAATLSLKATSPACGSICSSPSTTGSATSRTPPSRARGRACPTSLRAFSSPAPLR